MIREINIVARTVDIANRLFGFDVNAACDLADLCHVVSSTERVAIRDRARFGAQHLRVSQLKFLVRVRGDGKDAGLKKVFASVFEQSRIALPTHNLVVDASRLFARADFADEPAIAVPDGELCD